MPAKVPVGVQVVVDRLQPGNETSDLVGGDPVKRDDVRKLHQRLGDRLRPRREDPGRVQAVPDSVHVPGVACHEVPVVAHASMLPIAPDAVDLVPDLVPT